MSRKWLALAISALFATVAHAQAVVPISQLPAANTPLSGAEILPCVQGGVTKGCLAGSVGTPPANPANRDIYVSTLGSDSNDGSSWGKAKQTLQAGENAAAGGGTVHVGAGTYNLASTYAKQPGVRTLCVDGAVITQANGRNLTTLIDFNANTANGASLWNCTVDGNRANNADSASAVLVNVGGASDVVVSSDQIKNGNGAGLDVSSAQRTIVYNSVFSNFYIGGIYLTGGGNGKYYSNHFSGFLGQHAIGISNSDHNLVFGNTIAAHILTGMTVNTTVVGAGGGNMNVTATAGPSFLSLSPGEFVIMNGTAGYSEFSIVSITDATHLVASSPGAFAAQTGAPMIAGTGDDLGVTSASYNRVVGNDISGGAGGGIVVSNFGAGESVTKYNLVEANTVSGTGEGCYEASGTSLFSSTISDTSFVGNVANNCGLGGSAVASSTQYGFALSDSGTSTLFKTYLDGNYTRDDQGSPTTKNWLLADTSNGQVFVGSNRGQGTINPGIASGISSITTSGWGTSPTISSIVGMGRSFWFSITAGAGPTANPTITVFTNATAADNPPVYNCKQVSNSSTLSFFTVYGENPGSNSSANSVTFFVLGTPTSGTTYEFECVS